jgi:hypothetical protein
LTQLYYSSAAGSTTLSVALFSAASGSVGSITVASIGGNPPYFPFTLLVDWNTPLAEAITITQPATGTGPYVYANCIRGDDGTAAVSHGVGATVVHGVSARDFQKHPMVENVLTYGADPTGVADSTTAFQDAINALPSNPGSFPCGGVVYVPAGTYTCNTGQINVVAGLHLIGDGYQNTKINITGGGSGYLFNLDPPSYSSTNHVEDLVISGFTINATGADIYWGANIVRSKIVNNYHVQNSNANAVMNVSQSTGSHGTTYLAENEFANKELINGNARTIEAWHIDCSGTGLRCNDNVWHNGGSKIWPPTNGYWLKLIGDASGSQGSRKNKFRDLIFECASGAGGFLDLRNVGDVLIDTLSSEDLASATPLSPLINIGTNGTGGSTGVLIKNYSRRAGVLNSSVPDIKCDSNTVKLTIDSPDEQSGGNGLIFDLGNASNVTLTGLPASYTILNGSGINYPVNPLIDAVAAPSGAFGQTAPIWAVTTTGAALTSGTVYLVALELVAGFPVSNLTFFIDNTAQAGGSHGWYVLCDSGRVVRAVSADQTGATVWGSANSALTLSVSGSNYTTTYTGRYYIGVCINATTMPTFSASGSIRTNMAGAFAGLLSGTSSTGQTTPPATGTTLAAISGLGSAHYYGSVS